MTVQIVTDSAADIAPALAEELGIRVVPLSIRFGDEEFTDGVDLSTEGFYEKMAATSELPSTAAPAPGAFEAAMREAGANGDPVVCINLSSALSATMQSAQNAARAIGSDLDVRVLDSHSITGGEGMLVLAAAEAAAGGAGPDEIEALVADLSGRTAMFGALNTLDNLKKGGRIGNAQALLGGLLSIKPIIDISTGSVEEASKQRTRGKALVWLRDRLFQEDEVADLALCHGHADDVEEMLALLAPRYSRDQISIWTIGAVIGAHGGPAVMGLVWHRPA